MSNGLDTDCSVKRLLGCTYVQIAPFPFLLFLCQKKSKYGRDVVLSVAWSELWGELPGGKGRFFYPARLVGICPGCVTLFGTSARPDRWKVVTISAFRRSVGCRLSLGCSCGASGWHPQAPQLYHSIFQTISPVVGKRRPGTTAYPSDGGSNTAKRVLLTRKTCRGPLFISGRIQGFQCQSDGKGWFPLIHQEWGERWACLATFILALGLGEVRAGKAWNLRRRGEGEAAGQTS